MEINLVPHVIKYHILTTYLCDSRQTDDTINETRVRQKRLFVYITGETAGIYSGKIVLI